MEAKRSSLSSSRSHRPSSVQEPEKLQANSTDRMHASQDDQGLQSNCRLNSTITSHHCKPNKSESSSNVSRDESTPSKNTSIRREVGQDGRSAFPATGISTNKQKQFTRAMISQGVVTSNYIRKGSASRSNRNIEQTSVQQARSRPSKDRDGSHLKQTENNQQSSVIQSESQPYSATRERSRFVYGVVTCYLFSWAFDDFSKPQRRNLLILVNWHLFRRAHELRNRSTIFASEDIGTSFDKARVSDGLIPQHLVSWLNNLHKKQIWSFGQNCYTYTYTKTPFLFNKKNELLNWVLIA